MWLGERPEMPWLGFGVLDVGSLVEEEAGEEAGSGEDVDLRLF